jgi:15-cis-phytoene synthase
LSCANHRPRIHGQNNDGIKIVKLLQPISSRPPRSTIATSPERACGQRLSALVGSSSYRALSDDALKDEDNAAWVMGLTPNAKRAWLDRIHWIRLVDRLAENERFEPHAHRFGMFLDAWRLLFTQGRVDPMGPFARELSSIRALWFAPSPTDGDGGGGGGDAEKKRRSPSRAGAVDSMARRSIDAWDAYLAALADYHAPNLVIDTLEEHDTMLWRLSGRIFQLVPFLTEELWSAAGEFGRLDQFFNNLRDMQEDAELGICYLPGDVLSRHGITRGQVISGRCVDEPGYTRMMRFWLDEHLPTLFARAAPFIEADDLHPSLEIMKRWSLKRYERITRVVRATGFDHRRFPARYWAEVRRDLFDRRSPARCQPV